MEKINIIPARSGVSLIINKGQLIKIIDLEGEQVADFICYNLHDRAEFLSSGRTIDYNETIYLTKGHSFYSNRSNIMFDMIEDSAGRHDFLLTPCSSEMFRIIYGHKDPHKGCFGNLCDTLKEHGIEPDDIPTTFNIFMNVAVNGETGKISVLPPLTKAGDHVVLEARMDLIVGLTACAAGMSNNFSFKPIGYQVMME
jgi:uncharacterized protein YcgI (DUF1989 family)